jgi:hypothetical protein
LEFNAAVSALESTWWDRYKDDAELQEILCIFMNEYVDENSGWWAGFLAEMPRTNNSLESSNKQLKAQMTDWHRQPLRQFLTTASEHMRISSISPSHQVCL